MRRPWLAPFVPLYAAVLRLKSNFAATPKKLTWPVISIGRFSAGGAGKTPIGIALAKLLSSRGHAVDVLSRGYRRESTGTQRVNPAHEDAPTFYGDEPVLIERSANVPVYVSSDRFAAGTLAEREAPTGERGIHLLDDGFQHRRLARTVDIALITAEDLADTLIPGGNLREPLSNLKRADIVIIREEEREAVERAVSAGMPAEDLVYPALWLQLLEKKLRVPSSGLVEDAYATIDNSSGWPSRLRAWATGRLTDAELLAAARDRSQRTEAIFYAAMARHAQGSAEDAKAGFQQVLKSEAIDLVEISISRDLLASYESPRNFKLPPNVVVP